MGPTQRIRTALALVEYRGSQHQHGNFTVRVEITDQSGATASHHLIVSVANVNDAPVVHRPTHIVKTNETHALTFFSDIILASAGVGGYC